MIVSLKEIEELEKVLSECVGDKFDSCTYERDTAISYLALRPHLLFPVGFSEARIFSKKNKHALNDLNRPNPKSLLNWSSELKIRDSNLLPVTKSVIKQFSLMT